MKATSYPHAEIDRAVLSVMRNHQVNPAHFGELREKLSIPTTGIGALDKSIQRLRKQGLIKYAHATEALGAQPGWLYIKPPGLK